MMEKNLIIIRNVGQAGDYVFNILGMLAIISVTSFFFLVAKEISTSETVKILSLVMIVLSIISFVIKGFADIFTFSKNIKGIFLNSIVFTISIGFLLCFIFLSFAQAFVFIESLTTKVVVQHCLY